ncbi:Pentatricopeptide repeat-containing protein, mitochondrial [Vitis vinifera]|uniref:Pentatricopeptide repeat-containing protein, mitochondrial n=1 Tax=Vitis vinifera TaxID=29760 RepID=A0A438J3K3_VITVI|nr:Pentatricopeptide repeat-containing protein, mitochondrial [Vitis vinifera]
MWFSPSNSGSNPPKYPPYGPDFPNPLRSPAGRCRRRPRPPPPPAFGAAPGFHHTRATFHATFKILARAKLMSLMLDFLQNYTELRYVHRVRFYDTLVMGYAVAGKPEIALQLFAKMRFQGLDLDSFAYHVLLNALVEENCFDAFRVVGQLDEAKAFVEQLVESGRVGLSGGHMVGLIVDALCKRKRFGEAGRLVEEFQGSGMVSVEQAYGVWIRDLVRAGRLDGALEFLHSKKESEGYVPEVCGYNILICRLLRENRLEEVLDLLMEMREGQILPDKAEFGLSPNSMAYNYLINTLCGDGSTDEAYHVLKHSLEQGYFPGKKTFSILADALCQEGKLDKMKELVLVALDRNIMPSASTYDKFILALCKARRVDDDIAARLLIELQEKGHTPTRSLFRAVICRLCDMDNAEKQFLKLLELQLSHQEPNCQVYNFFIDGAGHAKKPELAREVFEMMVRSGIVPNLSSDILMLQSYLKNERISDALNFFSDLQKRRKVGRKLCNTMVVGLCKANKVDIALEILKEIREKGVTPSLECYEELVKTPELFETWVHAKDAHNEISSPNLILGQLIGEFSGCIGVNQDFNYLEEVMQQCFPLDLYTYNMLLRRLTRSDMDLALELFNRICQKGKYISKEKGSPFLGSGTGLIGIASSELKASLAAKHALKPEAHAEPSIQVLTLEVHLSGNKFLVLQGQLWFTQVRKQPSLNPSKNQNRSLPMRKFVNTIAISRTLFETLNSKEWKQTMKVKMEASDKNGTWDVVELPREKSQERCKWVFTIKYKVDGSLERDTGKTGCKLVETPIDLNHKLEEASEDATMDKDYARSVVDVRSTIG